MPRGYSAVPRPFFLLPPPPGVRRKLAHTGPGIDDDEARWVSAIRRTVNDHPRSRSNQRFPLSPRGEEFGNCRIASRTNRPLIAVRLYQTFEHDKEPERARSDLLEATAIEGGEGEGGARSTWTRRVTDLKERRNASTESDRAEWDHGIIRRNSLTAQFQRYKEAGTAIMPPVFFQGTRPRSDGFVFRGGAIKRSALLTTMTMTMTAF